MNNTNMDQLLQQTSEIEIIARLTVAAILGLIIGIERSHAGKSAGMRTYSLVATGSALFVGMTLLVSNQFINSGHNVFDPLRVASQIVVGIGFLGAGVIFVEKQVLTGLTTAAGLWVTAAIGAVTGFGFFAVATYTTALVLFIFEGLWYIENRFVRKASRHVDAQHRLD